MVPPVQRFSAQTEGRLRNSWILESGVNPVTRSVPDIKLVAGGIRTRLYEHHILNRRHNRVAPKLPVWEWIWAAPTGRSIWEDEAGLRDCSIPRVVQSDSILIPMAGGLRLPISPYVEPVFQHRNLIGATAACRGQICSVGAVGRSCKGAGGTWWSPFLFPRASHLPGEIQPPGGALGLDVAGTGRAPITTTGSFRGPNVLSGTGRDEWPGQRATGSFAMVKAVGSTGPSSRAKQTRWMSK